MAYVVVNLTTTLSRPRRPRTSLSTARYASLNIRSMKRQHGCTFSTNHIQYKEKQIKTNQRKKNSIKIMDPGARLHNKIH